MCIRDSLYSGRTVCNQVLNKGPKNAMVWTMKNSRGVRKLSVGVAANYALNRPNCLFGDGCLLAGYGNLCSLCLRTCKHFNVLLSCFLFCICGLTFLPRESGFQGNCVKNSFYEILFLPFWKNIRNPLPLESFDFFILILFPGLKDTCFELSSTSFFDSKINI